MWDKVSYLYATLAWIQLTLEIFLNDIKDINPPTKFGWRYIYKYMKVVVSTLTL